MSGLFNRAGAIEGLAHDAITKFFTKPAGSLRSDLDREYRWWAKVSASTRSDTWGITRTDRLNSRGNQEDKARGGMRYSKDGLTPALGPKMEMIKIHMDGVKAVGNPSYSG